MKITILYLLFLTISAILYYPARYAGFTHDMVSWAMQYDKYYFWEGLKIMFGDKALHPIYHTVNFWIYKLFGVNSLAWYLIQIILHASIAFWGFLFCYRVFDKSNVAFWGALLFLISPYQTEVVVWKATLHYLICSAAILGSLNYFLNYYHHPNDRKSLFYTHFTFVIAIFSLELGVTIPLFLSLLILYLPTKTPKISLFTKVVVPQLLTVVLFFIATKIFTGGWTGHYGASTHLAFSPEIVVPNFLKYCYKFLFFGQYIKDINQNDALFNTFEAKSVIYIVLLSLFFLILFFGYKMVRGKQSNLLLLFSFSLIALLPVVNLFVYTLTPVLSDRFSYLFSLFFFMTLLYGASELPKVISFIVIVLFIYCSLRFLPKNIDAWALNGKWMSSLMNNYEWFDEKEVYILTCFDSINGTLGLRSEYEGYSSVAEALSVYRKDKIVKGKINEIYMYNPRNEVDTIRKYVKEGDRYGLVIPDGTWFIRNAKGTSNLTTDAYEAKIDEWSVGVSLRFKQADSSRVVIFQQKDKWIKF
jgi:hypothetical protein